MAAHRPAMRIGVTFAALALLAPSLAARQLTGPPPAIGSLIDEAYATAFNLDHDRAIAIARRAVALAPESASAHRTLASMLWMKILFQRGAVSVDNYMSGMAGSQKHLPKPAAALDKEFHAELGRAIALAEDRLDLNGSDIGARYDAGAAYGLQASYAASIDGSLTSAFRTARRAFDAQEQVLERSPQHPHASVTVGTYRYLISALSLPARWFAYVAGFGGGKERGIGMLEAAFENPDASVEAGAALMLIYTREGRHEDALALARQLSERYPRNRLLVLEAGAAAIRAGLAEEAEDMLTRGLSALDRDPRPRVPGERAIWLYKRGLARLARNRADDALGDFRSALDSQPAGWWRGRIHVGLGKIDDLAGRRDAARAHYAEARRICEPLADVICEDEARTLERRPFVMSGRDLG
jgi:tetratricopeptide (TPR) repeat protein